MRSGSAVRTLRSRSPARGLYAGSPARRASSASVVLGAFSGFAVRLPAAPVFRAGELIAVRVLLPEFTLSLAQFLGPFLQQLRRVLRLVKGIDADRCRPLPGVPLPVRNILRPGLPASRGADLPRTGRAVVRKIRLAAAGLYAAGTVRLAGILRRAVTGTGVLSAAGAVRLPGKRRRIVV